MRIRGLLTSAAVISLTIASTQMVPGAMAQKGVVLSPQTGWAVTEIQDEGRGTGSYCAMAKRFRNNLILTVAQNSHSESSIALDFARGNFDTRQYFAVTLDPGSGQHRSYEIQPASRKAFVIRLGKDPAFFQALQKTGFLRAEIGGEFYNFNLADIDSGQSQLDGCIANTVLPAAGKSNPIPVPSQTVAASDLQGKLSSLQAQIESLKSENQTLSGDIERERLRVDSQSAAPSESVANLNGRVTELENENEILRIKLAQRKDQGGVDADQLAQIERLRKDNTVLRADLDRFRLGNADTSALHTEIASLREENKRLAALAESGKPSPDVNADNAAALAGLQQENKDLKSRLEKAGRQSVVDIEKLQAEIKKLQHENSTLLAKTSGVQSDVEQKYEERIAEIARENENLKLNLEKASLDKDLVEHLRKQIGLLETENRTIQTRATQQTETTRSQKDAELSALSSENARLKQGLDNEKSLTEAQKQTIANLEAQLGELKNHNTVLKTELSAIKEDVNANYKVKIQQLEVENNELQASLADGIANEKAKESLEARLREIEIERKNLEAAMTSAKAEAGEEIAALQAKVEGLEKQVAERDLALLDASAKAVQAEELRVEIRESKLKAAETQAAVTDLQATIAGLEKENAALSASLESTVRDTKAVLDQEVARLEGEKANLQSALQAEQEKVTSLEGLKGELAQAKEINAQLQAKVATIAPLQADMQQLESENAELKETLKTKEAAFQSARALQSRLSDLEVKHSRINASLKLLEAEAVKYQETIDLQKEEIAQLKQEKHALKAVMVKDTQAMQIMSLKEEIAYLHDENRTLAKQINDARFEVVPARAVSVNKELEAENEVLRRRISEVRIEAEKNKKHAIEALSKEYMRVKQELQRAQDQEQTQAQSINYEPPKSLAPTSEPEPQREVRAPIPLRPEVIEPASGQANAPEAVIEEASAVPQSQPEPEPVTEPVQASIEESEQVEEQIVEIVPERAELPEIDPADYANMNEAQRLEADLLREMSAPPIVGVPKERSIAEVIEPILEEPEVVEVGHAESTPGIVVEIPEIQEDRASEISWNSARKIAKAPEPSPAPMAPEIDPEPLSIQDIEPAAQTFTHNNTLPDILGRAGVLLDGDISVSEDETNASKTIYLWSAQDVYGSAEQSPIRNTEREFDAYVETYLEITAARCPGEFAAVPNYTSPLGQVRVDSYEIACVGDDISSTAALVFYSEDGTFTALAHEASMDKMAAAMDIRDRLIKTLTGSSS